MSLQARMSPGDQRLYNPSRDVAHCFVPAVKEVAARLERGQWKAVSDYLKNCGVDLDQQGRACETFMLFVYSSARDPKASMADALADVGWLRVPEPAQVAYMAYLGTVMAGMFFCGVREATLGGVGPLSEAGDLVKAGREAHRAIATPRWQRPWRSCWRRMKGAWHGFRSK